MPQTTPYPDSTLVRPDVVSDKAHAGIDRLSASAHHAVDRAAGAATIAADRLGAKSRELLSAGDEWVDVTRGYVRDHPLAALGVALAAGYLLSRMLSR